MHKKLNTLDKALRAGAVVSGKKWDKLRVNIKMF